MRSLQISVSLKPAIVEWLEAMAAKKQMSRSEYVARILENEMDDDYVVTREEADRWAQDLVKDPETGEPKVWNDVDSFMKDLQDEVRAYNKVH